MNGNENHPIQSRQNYRPANYVSPLSSNSAHNDDLILEIDDAPLVREESRSHPAVNCLRDSIDWCFENGTCMYTLNLTLPPFAAIPLVMALRQVWQWIRPLNSHD